MYLIILSLFRNKKTIDKPEDKPKDKPEDKPLVIEIADTNYGQYDIDSMNSTQIIIRVYPELKHCLDCPTQFIKQEHALNHDKYHIPKIYGDSERARKLSRDYIQGNMGSSENSLIIIKCNHLNCGIQCKAYYIHFNEKVLYKTYCTKHCPTTDNDKEVIVLLNQTPSQIAYNNMNYS